MKRARIIYNPTSGREAFQKELPRALRKLEEAGYEASTHATTGEGDATEAARTAVTREYDVVIAAGGDGTINEVVNGLAEQPFRPKLGVIPVGTTNDFARSLRIPRNIQKAIDVVIAGNTKKIDIGKIDEDRYFIYIAGGGKITELTYEVPSKLKTMLGQLAYYIKGIEMLPFMKPINVRIEYDDHILEEPIMMFLISNSNSIGGFERANPLGEMDDGYFDLLIVRKTHFGDIPKIATSLLKGNHIHHDKIIYTKTKSLTVDVEENVSLNIDGEYGGLLPGKFVNLYQHIEFFVPENTD
ncbi:diacylglycerol kinase [Salinibacillus aidingensis]|uniref:Diacylglycerol kinase n=1 Tax=Salinibacillus aidingensis TaxID=237684 RepID=A0ABP3LBZ6_9BACI